MCGYRKGYWLLSASKWLNSGCRGRIAQSLHPVWHKVRSVNFHTWVLHFHTQAVIILGVLFNTLQIAQASKWGVVSSWHQQANLACMALVYACHFERKKPAMFVRFYPNCSEVKGVCSKVSVAAVDYWSLFCSIRCSHIYEIRNSYMSLVPM